MCGENVSERSNIRLTDNLARLLPRRCAWRLSQVRCTRGRTCVGRRGRCSAWWCAGVPETQGLTVLRSLRSTDAPPQPAVSYSAPACITVRYAGRRGCVPGEGARGPGDITKTQWATCQKQAGAGRRLPLRAHATGVTGEHIRVRYVILPRMFQGHWLSVVGCGVTAGPRARSPAAAVSLRPQSLQTAAVACACDGSLRRALPRAVVIALTMR
jgi:hypothetical protein